MSNKLNEEGYNKLYKIEIHYNGNNTYTIKPVTDKNGNQLNKGSMIICGDDDSIKKFFMKIQIKDSESNPASARKMKYMDMVLGIKSGIGKKNFYMWKKNWQPSHKKIDLMIK